MNIVYNNFMLTYTDDTPERLNEQAKELQRIAREMRRKEFQKLREEGKKLHEIAKLYGITKQRVKQILDGE
jgi:DNA-directed RNA polymerase sigma subunit (sigma70/sigma32)